MSFTPQDTRYNFIGCVQLKTKTWLTYFFHVISARTKTKYSTHRDETAKCYLYITSRTRANYILRQPSKTSASSRYWLVRKIAQLCQINVIKRLIKVYYSYCKWRINGNAFKIVEQELSVTRIRQLLWKHERLLGTARRVCSGREAEPRKLRLEVFCNSLNFLFLSICSQNLHRKMDGVVFFAFAFYICYLYWLFSRISLKTKKNAVDSTTKICTAFI